LPESSNPLNDALLIAVILALGLVFDLPGSGIWRLTAHQFALGGALTLALSLFGTGLPIMIFFTCILVPRYHKLTGSTAATCVLGGFNLCRHASHRILDALRFCRPRRPFL